MEEARRKVARISVKSINYVKKKELKWKVNRYQEKTNCEAGVISKYIYSYDLLTKIIRKS